MFGPLVGVVHLCPCIKMTFRDKLKLVAKMKEGSHPMEQSKSLDAKLPERDRTHCWHECSYNYGSARVHVKINPILEDDGNLLITTEYSVTGAMLPSDLGLVPRLCCPHRSIYMHISDIMELSRYHGWLENGEFTEPVTCKWCQTLISDVKWSLNLYGDEQDYCSFQTLRQLGKGNYDANRGWHEQTHFSFETLDVKEQLERMPWRSWVRRAMYQ
jgi:hypothetical protein